MSEFKFEIVKRLFTLSKSDKGWTKGLNRVSFSGAELESDIRSWNPDHSKVSKGMTLTDGEFKIILDAFRG